MITDPGFQLLLTCLFLTLAAFLLVRMWSDRDRGMQSFGHFLHAVMALDMAAMVWPWWFHVPLVPQLVLFLAASAWFLGLFVLQLVGTIPSEELGGHGAWHQAVHMLMMIAMTWMVAVMIPPDGGGHDPHAHGVLAGWATTSGTVLIWLLVASGIVLLIEFARTQVELERGDDRERRGWEGAAGESSSAGIMTIAMAWMCWLMLTH